MNAEAIADPDSELRALLPRNFLGHATEGGLFMAGLAFTDAQTILPTMIRSLGGADWVVASTPLFLMVGFFTPSLFITHRIEQFERLKAFVLWVGFVQRLPYLIVGGYLVLGSPSSVEALCLIVLAPILSGFAGGVSLPAWREYVAKCIPIRRLASMWAVRFVIAGCFGVLVGQLVEQVLSAHPMTQGYGLLHLGVFGLMAVSWLMFTLTREPNQTSRRTHASQSWREHAGVVRRAIHADPVLPRYLITRLLCAGVFVVTPFLGIHALSVLGQADSYLGQLVTYQMAGSLLGNLLAGVIGDRRGARTLMLGALGIGALMAICAIWVSSPIGFAVVYTLLGLNTGLSMVANPTMDLEISPFELRMSYQAALGLAYLIGMLGAACAVSLIRNYSQDFSVLGGLGATMLLLACTLLLQIPEPRSQKRQRPERSGNSPD